MHRDFFIYMCWISIINNIKFKNVKTSRPLLRVHLRITSLRRLIDNQTRRWHSKNDRQCPTITQRPSNRWIRKRAYNVLLANSMDTTSLIARTRRLNSRRNGTLLHSTLSHVNHHPTHICYGRQYALIMQLIWLPIQIH